MPNIQSNVGSAEILIIIKMGIITEAKRRMHNSTPNIKLSFWQYSTKNFSNLATKNDDTKEIRPQNINQLTVYYPPIKEVKNELKLVKMTVKVALAVTLFAGNFISIHLGVSMTCLFKIKSLPLHQDLKDHLTHQLIRHYNLKYIINLFAVYIIISRSNICPYFSKSYPQSFFFYSFSSTHLL